jgi:hypothetical protein
VKPFWEDATQQQIFRHCMKMPEREAQIHLPALLRQLQEIRNLPEPGRA